MSNFGNYLRRLSLLQPFVSGITRPAADVGSSSRLVNCPLLLGQVRSLLENLEYDFKPMRIPFSLYVRPSIIRDAGSGVFLSGRADPGTVVAFYPGTVYLPGEPLFFASIRNAYVLRCFDGLFVDGKNRGMSASFYDSISRMHSHGGLLDPIADTSWLQKMNGFKNPFAVGQMINNGMRRFPPNGIRVF